MVIIHFQSVEKYPSVMNLVSYLKGNSESDEITIYTTKSSPDIPVFEADHVNIIRFGTPFGIILSLSSIFLFLYRDIISIVHDETGKDIVV